MAGMVCELCGSTDFVKEGGLFVCQKCGMKYSLEDARRIMEEEKAKEGKGVFVNAKEKLAEAKAAKEAEEARKARARQAAARHDPGARVPAAAPKPKPQVGADPTVNPGDPVSLNNHACEVWKALLADFKKIEHPSKERREELAAKAVESLTVLRNAANLDPGNDVLNLAVFTNCCEIVDSVRDTKYWDKNSEGEWRSHSFSPDTKLTLPHQTDSWTTMRDNCRASIKRDFMSANPELKAKRDDLSARAAELQAKLDELNEEKKSHSLFDFAGKGEVKERMKPYQNELGDVNSQIYAIDKQVTKYVEGLLSGMVGFLHLDL